MKEQANDVSTHRELPKRVEVAVVGAGLAGLVCARALRRAGKDVHLFEAGPEIGGRVRTEQHREGFLLDVGFHVLLTGYPSVAKELDLTRLDLRPFEPGFIVARQGNLYPLSDPDRGGSWREALRFPLGTIGDKLKMRSLRSSIVGGRATPTPTESDRSTMGLLRNRGFSDRFIRSVFVPFFSGVFLDRSLGNSSGYFESVFRSFQEGPVGIPAEGIGAVPRQIAEEIPAETIHTDCPVGGLVESSGRVVGLSIEGQEVRAETVILATDPATSATLSLLPFPEYKSLGLTVCYFTADRPPTDEKRLFVRADENGWTNHFAVSTNIAPSLAPEGKHLLMGAILGTHEITDGNISEKIRREMGYWFPHAQSHDWRWLRTFRLVDAQWAFPPGMREALPGNRTSRPGLLLAGDYTLEPSVEGALRSGREASEAYLETAR